MFILDDAAPPRDLWLKRQRVTPEPRIMTLLINLRRAVSRPVWHLVESELVCLLDLFSPVKVQTGTKGGRRGMFVATEKES